MIEVRGRNLDAVKQFTTSVLFNPSKLALEEGEDGRTGGQVKAEGSTAGVLRLTVAPPKNNGSDVLIAKLVLQGKEKGLSYLLLNNSDSVLDKSGNVIGMELGNSKLEVR